MRRRVRVAAFGRDQFDLQLRLFVGEVHTRVCDRTLWVCVFDKFRAILFRTGGGWEILNRVT